MFTHNLKYFYKILTKNKGLIFWTFIFPLILGTFFYMAFKDIENNETFKPFSIAVVNNNDYVLKNALLNSKDIFDNVYNTDIGNARKLLQDKKITGIIDMTTGKPEVYVNTSGINETILKFFIDELTTKQAIDFNTFNNKIINISNDNLSYTMIEFYTLIAMTALYGGSLSIYIINKILPNMSSMGKRISVSPVKKKTFIISGSLASLIVLLISLTTLFLYTIFILHVDYGNHLLLVLLLALLGSISGISLGLFIGTIFKFNENTKSGILIALTMFLSFLSGMMGITMKYVIDKNIPILNIINPANMITDGLYSLYYYDTFNRYTFDILSLIVFSVFLVLISSVVLRRQKYDSI